MSSEKGWKRLVWFLSIASTFFGWFALVISLVDGDLHELYPFVLLFILGPFLGVWACYYAIRWIIRGFKEKT